MAKASGGGGRDVIFRLRVMADPNEAYALKKFGDAAAKAQKKIEDDAVASNKQKNERVRTEETRAQDWLERVRKKSMNREMQDNERLQNERIKAAERTQNWLDRVKRNSAQLEFKEGLRVTRDLERERIASVKRIEREEIASARRAASARTAASRDAIGRAEGMRKIIGGGATLARAAAFSGALGEEDSSRMLNLILAGETAASAVHGGIEVSRGLGMMGRGRTLGQLAGAVGVTAGGAGALAAGGGTGGAGAAAGGTAAAGVGTAAPLAAIAAWLPAIAAGLKGLHSYATSKPGTPESKPSGAFGSGVNWAYGGAMSLMPDSWVKGLGITNPQSAWRNPSGQQEGLLTPYTDAILSGRRLAKNQASSAAWVAEQQKKYGALPTDIATRLAQSQDTIR